MESYAQRGYFPFAGCTGFWFDFYAAAVSEANKRSTAGRTDDGSGSARQALGSQRAVDSLLTGHTGDYRRGATPTTFPNGSHNIRRFAHELRCDWGRKHRAVLLSERDNDDLGCF